MVKNSKGTRTGTRQLISRKPRERGLSPITRSLQRFEIGEYVNIVIDPSIHKGMPHKRFHGLTGTIYRIQGDAFIVKVKVGNKYKHPIICPDHLRRSA